MYFFLYDAFLREKKFEVTLARIESRLFDLGLQGKSEKLTILKSMKELVESAIKRGADTIVAVGNDQTMSKIIRIIADRDVILGFLPVGGRSVLADVLGIPQAEKACDVLSARIIERLDLGKANDAYFLSFLELTPSKELLIECDGNYHIEPAGGEHSLSIFNFGHQGRDPRDGVLEAVVRPEEQGRRGLFRRETSAMSVFSFRTMRVKSLGKSVPAYADGQTVVKTPVTVSVVPGKVRIIVGKRRQFS